MWFDQSEHNPAWAKGVEHLAADPVLRGLIERVGPCTLSPRTDHFVVLCQSIFNQQLSVKGAATLFGRFRDQFPRRRPTPKVVAAFIASAPEETLRHVGLSRQKRSYLADLSAQFADGRIRPAKLAAMSDDEVVDYLTQVKGIGRWTAEMLLIFNLNRPDVLPVDDLGLIDAAKLAYGLPARPTRQELAAMAEPWRPWRTLATWYLWRGKEG
ncbi:MAG: DNA-3-methyladenine glycosylase family protein [Phycisphaerae bacterium]